MCRKSQICSALGTDPETWDRYSPLRPPSWFEEQLSIFTKAAEIAAQGDRFGAIGLIQTIRSDEMRFWFDEHGQMSGLHRKRHFKISAPDVKPDEFDAVRRPTRYEQKVFELDSYTCRYCGLRLLSKAVLVAFERAVGSDVFRTTGSNPQQHGVVHAFKIVADHVVPHTRGGRTHPDNLVSACPACNYGKDAYTIEQIGIADPRDRPPTSSGWDGLTSLVAELKSNTLMPA